MECNLIVIVIQMYVDGNVLLANVFKNNLVFAPHLFFYPPVLGIAPPLLFCDWLGIHSYHWLHLKVWGKKPTNHSGEGAGRVRKRVWKKEHPHRISGGV